MRPSSFELTRPTSLLEATSLARDGAVPLSGGQALLQSMRLRTAQPAALVDLKRVAELSPEIRAEGGAIHIGALATAAGLLDSAVVAERLPMLREAAGRLGDVQVRNRATVVGNVCWADPRANLAVALIAYDAVLTISDGQRERRQRVADVFAGYRALTLAAGEIVTAVDVPAPDRPEPAAYREFSRQRNDLALVSMAVARGAGGRHRVAAGGLAQTPLRLAGVEALLAGGSRPSIDALRVAVAGGPVSSLGDPFGSLDYKVHVGAVLLSRILATFDIEGASHA